jgi:Xaa-Pro aminopeptidase
MKYHQIDRDLFIKTETNLCQMKPKKRCRFNSNDIYPIETDSTMPFEQSRDIFYLSGVDQESILLLFPDAPYEHKRNIISKRNKRPYSRLGKNNKERISRYWNKDSVLAARF